MNVVASLYLRAKRWQVFVLFFGTFVFAQVAFVASIFGTSRSPENSLKVGLPVWMAIVLSTFCILGWFWALGLFLNSIVVPPLRLRVGLFRFALLYPALYIVLFMAFFGSTNPLLFAVIIPLHLLAMFCMFYCLYFVSKSLVLAETGKPASFSDYAGPFFLMWFYPLGVWFIQPRVNRLYAGRNSQQAF